MTVVIFPVIWLFVAKREAMLSGVFKVVNKNLVILTEQEPDFKPKAETLSAFLKSGLLSVRKRALNTFETYYPSIIKSLEGYLSVWQVRILF